jgi:hypothetical protein
MRQGCALLPLMAVLMLLIGDCQCAMADGPGTLLQWGGGPPVEGGPDLNEPLVTDRPDFTNSSVTVGMGVVQLESGYTFTYNDDEPTTTKEHSYPELLLRVGMFAEWCELRLGWNYGNSAESVFGAGDLDLEGAQDLYLGSKICLTPQSGYKPETGIVIESTLPTGAGGFTSGEVLAGVDYVYGWTVNDFFDIGGSTQAHRAIDPNNTDFYVQFAQSITTGYTWTEKFGGYAEWYVLAPAGAVSAQNQHYFNTGITYLITDNIQWDFRAGVGLNDAADDMFTGSGISFRWY